MTIFDLIFPFRQSYRRSNKRDGSKDNVRIYSCCVCGVLRVTWSTPDWNEEYWTDWMVLALCQDKWADTEDQTTAVAPQERPEKNNKKGFVLFFCSYSANYCLRSSAVLVCSELNVVVSRVFARFPVWHLNVGEWNLFMWCVDFATVGAKLSFFKKKTLLSHVGVDCEPGVSRPWSKI